jgi:hypothetical protein
MSRISLPVTMAPDFTHCGGVPVGSTTIQCRNLDTASYATISGFGNSVTFETQRLTPTLLAHALGARAIKMHHRGSDDQLSQIPEMLLIARNTAFTDGPDDPS